MSHEQNEIMRLTREKESMQSQFNAAIDFAIEQGHVEAAMFLSCWREGDTSDWPEFSPPEPQAADEIHSLRRAEEVITPEAEQQIAEALRAHELTLVRQSNGYAVMKLGQVSAQLADVQEREHLDVPDDLIESATTKDQTQRERV